MYAAISSRAMESQARLAGGSGNGLGSEQDNGLDGGWALRWGKVRTDWGCGLSLVPGLRSLLS